MYISTINHNTRINNRITAEKLLVIDEQGSNLGVLKTSEALKIAKERGLDLIEVSPLSKPPVARILDFDKYRYQQEKKLKKQKSGAKEETKQVQISVRSAQNDLMVKAKRANNFLAKGHVVRIVMVLRGRERANRDFAKEKLNLFLADLDSHKITMTPKFGGRGIITQIQK